MNDYIFSILFIGVILVLPFFGLIAIAKHYNEITCYEFWFASEREVKFVKYTFLSWDCLTPTKDGKYISTSMLRDID